MPRLAKPLDKETRRQFRDMDIITNRELARIVAKRAGVTIADAMSVINVLGDVIVELVIQKYCVMIYHLGSFFLRELYMPTYSYKEKRGMGYRKRWSFSFKKTGDLSKKINAQMREMYPEEAE